MKKIHNILLTAAMTAAAIAPAHANLLWSQMYAESAAATLVADNDDPRQRKPETIVQDVLALLPIQKQTDFNREMESLAKAAPVTIQMLAGMLQPAEKATNNKVEYAISGVVAYASANPKYKKAVLDGLQMATPRAADLTAREFLQAQMRLLGEVEPVEYTAHKGAEKYTALYDNLNALGSNAGKEIIKAVKNPDRAYRMEALKYATDHNLVTADLVKKVVAAYGSAKEDGKVDIINWLADNKVTTQSALMLKALKKGGAPAAAAIEALGRIGGDNALDVLLAQLGTANGEAATTALRSFKGDLNSKVPAALATAGKEKKLALLSLADARRLHGTNVQVFDLCNDKDADVAAAALKALPGVVTAKDADRIANLLDVAPQDKVAIYEKALRTSLGSMDNKDRLEKIQKYLGAVNNKPRFFSTLASTDSKEAVAILQAEWEKSKSTEALNALKQTSNFEASKALLAAARQGDDGALRRYVTLVNGNVKDLDSRCTRLVEAIGIAQNTDTKKTILKSLGTTPTMPAFTNVAKFLDDKELAYTAAYAAKDIAGKCVEELDYKQLNDVLTKSMATIKAAGSADDGYAVDEIKKMLAAAEPSPIFELSPEEQKEGWELLFDGTNLDQWTGNKVGYVPVNGTIYVTANYGNESNLYTVKEYQDFVFRFEFCFLRPGVNNGVGIRTPMGVDAAYDGMCECQILDHDDPIYKGLHEYQVHGSVYGIIPAKRIKHKPLGEWSTEEIRVQGDHITVTVNGEVIVDGDIRKACQGHNVAPDGSENNPYTVDHRNHPGMFNKTGHIGFLGHGAGVKFRNVRVLDLTAKKPGKKNRK